MQAGRRFTLIAVLFAVAVLIVFVRSAPAAPSRIPIIPTTDVTLAVEAVQDGRVVTYTIHYDNIGSVSVPSIDLYDQLPTNSTFLGDPNDLVDGVWNDTFRNVAPGDHSLVLAVRLDETVADGDPVVNLVTMEYLNLGQPVVKTYEIEFRASFPPAPTIPEGDAPAPGMPPWVFAMPLVAGGLGASAYGAYRQARRPRIEQVFLMHRSGMLIRHWAVSASPVRDIDILSAMFVILKEFVRDSFREKTGGLSMMQFGDSRMLLAEGRHSILATVVTGDRLNGLPGQIQAAIKDFEGRNGIALPEWTGQLEVLDGAGDVIDNLVAGRYGHLRRAT